MINDQPISLHLKMKGAYKFVIDRADGTKEETPWIDNLILNTGLNQLGNSESFVGVTDRLQVGTGTIPPDVLQTRLQVFLASTQFQGVFSSVNKGAPFFETESTFGYTFAQGAVVGNITEVGVCPGAGNNTDLFSRTLIVDEQGVPTALPIVALDRLTVFYKITTFPTLEDGSGSFVINGVTYNYVSRASNVASFGTSGNFLTPYFFSRLAGVNTADETTNGLAAVTSQPSGIRASSNICVNDPYVQDSHQTKGVVTFNINTSNFPIKAMTCGFGGQTQFVVTPAIPKTNTNELKMKFVYSWGRG
jgi:hypothetical protein